MSFDHVFTDLVDLDRGNKKSGVDFRSGDCPCKQVILK